ncbi:MAG: IclR family transcriptional regulator [Phycisphaeraceae bacterium]|nr:IclR family transcriptional regulator [Phycisphaeraceae bacterium]
MKSKDRQRYHVPNLERAIGILELLADHPDGLNMIEIAGRLEIPNNSVYRITSTLVSHKYLMRDDHSKRFRLSRKFLALGYASINEKNVVEMSMDVMRQLRDVTRETVLLGTLLDDAMIVLEQIPGSHPFKFMLDAGSRVQLHTSAPGKALLAFLPDSEQTEILARLKLVRFNERTITRKSDFKKALKSVHKQGYAVDCAEQLEGVHCIGAPILNQHGYPIAAIWITGPSERVPESSFEKLGKALCSHAYQISQRLGYKLL